MSVVGNWCKYCGQLVPVMSILFYFLKVSECANAELLAIFLALNKTCDNWANIKWRQTIEFLSETSRCEMTTYDLQSYTAEIKTIFPKDNHELILTSLKRNTHYMFYMRCDGRYSSNNISFVSGSKCITEDDSNPYSVREPEKATEGPISLTDTVVGTIFAVVGIAIIIIFIYYFWKNYQRRQRINRIFREVQTDPFSYLQNHMEDSSATNL